MSLEHRYFACCSWRGSTGEGYERNHREHTASAPPVRGSLALSADEAFLGRSDHLNPEQLVVLAAASCQLLSFLAVAARARIEVVAYDDEAEGVMFEEQPPVRLVRIVLRPRILVSSGPTEDRVRHLVAVAHRECYVANSLLADIDVEPQIDFQSAA